MDPALAATETSVALIAVLCALGVAALVALAVLARSVRIVESGTTVLVERYGCYTRQLAPGLHFLAPSESARRVAWSCLAEGPRGEVYRLVVDRDYIDTRVTQLDLPPFAVHTADRLVAGVNCVLYFYISSPHDAVYGIANLYEAISSIVETTLRSAICTLKLDEAIGGITKIRHAVEDALGEKQKQYGFTLQSFDLQSIDPPAAIVKATQDAVCAARTSEQAQRTAEADAAVASQRATARQQLRAIELATELADARATAARELCAAEAQAECARLRSEAEVAAYTARRAAGISDTLAVEEMRLKAWQALAERQHGTLIIPIESAPFFGATAARRLGAIEEEV